MPLLGMVFGAALWFTVIQALVLQTFCPLCLTAHGVAVIECLAGWLRAGRRRGADLAARQAVTWSLAGFLGIALLQLYGPVPPTHRVVSLVGADAATQQPVHAEGGGRMLVFEAIEKSYAVGNLPLIGKADATHVFVEYLDYRCTACRITSGFVDALIARHPNEVAVIILPVPLESECNPAHSPLAGQHPGSCELARLALAVWRQSPENFADFHRLRMLDPSLESARKDARAVISPSRFEAALADPWIDRLLEANISDWTAFSRDTDKLPKLLIPTGKIVHGPPSGEADFIRRLEQELGLTPSR
jgi:protein-disulfide isomerase